MRGGGGGGKRKRNFFGRPSIRNFSIELKKDFGGNLFDWLVHIRLRAVLKNIALIRKQRKVNDWYICLQKTGGILGR